ncbi:MAG: hypothetical protein WC655_19065, partial [Candidatus Hydrogenedentales bacterium]
MRRETHSRGAALIIVVAILAALFLISAYFYTSSRRDLRTATNAANAMRAKLAIDAGTSMAISFLQNDKALRPTATSLDHPWNSFFNGAWIAGKPWAFNGGGATWMGATGPQVPYIDFQSIVNLDTLVTANWNAARATIGLPETLPIHEALYVPRVQATPGDITGGFVVDYAYIDKDNTPAHIIDTWADVDSDGDGLKDAMWIPVPVEEFFGGNDKDEDPTPPANSPYIANESGDGIDNDLDYGIVGSNGLDDDGDGAIDEADEGIDEPGEVAYFVYWGGNDGLDNDADGDVDDAGEQKLFITAPLLGVVVNGVDDDGNGLVDDDTEAVQLFDSINVQVSALPLREYAGDPAGGDYTTSLDPAVGSADVDKIDNDYSLIVNEARGFAYLDNTDPQNRIKSYNLIDTDTYSSNLGPTFTVTAYGEAVCTVGGRVAVQIVDEASKVNVNAAGGVVAGPGSGVGTSNLLTWAFSDGTGPHEYDLRTIPNSGPVVAQSVSQFRSGAAHGDSGLDVGDPLTLTGSATAASLTLDAAFPGYGGVDDNGSALWMMLDGLDNDGDSPVYQSNGLDDNNNGIIDDPSEGIDELWEGIDEPQEFQWFRPLRNKIAETDALDNNDNDVLNEIGELGDRYYQTSDQLLDVNEIGDTRLVNMRPVVTVHSTDRNERYQRYYRNENTGVSPDPFQHEFPQTSGLKLDFNYALADGISNALGQDWDYPTTPETFTAGFSNVTEEIRAFSRGLRREDATVVGAPYGRAELVSGVFFEADAELRSLQLGLNIQDSRDTDHVRSQYITTELDTWWRDLTDALTPGTPNDGEEKSILYTQAGVEGIRINEIMVRPVRRVESEAVCSPHFGEAGYTAEIANLDPNRFTYLHTLAPGNPDVLWDFNVTQETIDERLGGGALTPANSSGTTPYLWEVNGGGYLGPRTYWQTNSPDGQDGLGSQVPNVVQFRFGPSAQLPPGRYYLTFNSMGPLADGGVGPTVAAAAQLQFAVKYAQEVGIGGDTDILQDIVDYVASADPDTALLVPPTALFGVNASAVIGYQDGLNALNALSPLSGWVMLPTTTSEYNTATNLNTPSGYNPDRYDGYGLNRAYTIVIPPYDDPTADENGDTINDNDQVYLYVAIRMDGGGHLGVDESMAVNFFDFSQEPDHEWVEVVNIAESNEYIDLSGWTLEVGGDRASTRVLRIPNDVKIAPGGSLLLVTDKYDIGSDLFDDAAFSAVPYVQKNGIGMARGPLGGDLEDITEPPIPNLCGSGFLANLYTGNPANVNEPMGPSIFRRIVDVDYVDRDGDGVPEIGSPDDLLPSTNDSALVINKGFAAGEDRTKAWDRIVQLESDVHAVPGGNGLETIARWVLGGGVFPNYPEENFLDDDGDNGALMSDGIDNSGNNRIWDFDGLDNDGDALIDEGRDGVDNNANGVVDERAEGEGVDELDAFTGLGEGFDEGRFSREAADFFDTDNLDNDGDTLIDEGADGVDNNGNGAIDDPAESEAFLVAVPGSFNPLPVDFGLATSIDYLTSQGVFEGAIG